MDEAVACRLLAAARNGNSEAFAALLLGYRRLFVSVAFARLGCRELAEDTAMEAVAEAWKQQGKLRWEDPAQARRWLSVVTLRKAARARAVELPQVALESVAEAESREPCLEDGIATLQAIASLPMGERVVYVLKVQDGLTSEEVARMLSECKDQRLSAEWASWPPNRRSIDNKYEQAVKRLRRCLGEGGA